jgi:hypothetical protein
MAEQFLTIHRGDSETFTETITGLASLAGFIARMIVYDADKNTVIEIEGGIDGLDVVYNLSNEVCRVIPTGSYEFETKLWDTSDHVHTPSYGIFIIEDTVEEDPS